MYCQAATTQHPRQSSAGRFGILRAITALCLSGACILSVLVVLAAQPNDVSAAAKGVIDSRLDKIEASSVDVDQAVEDIGGSLNAKWTRICVKWSLLQPNAPTDTDPGYNIAYVEHLKAVTAKLESAGINVILSPYLVPKWASNKALWASPPASYIKNQYYPFYAADTGNREVMDAYRAMCQYLAQTLSPAPYGVHHFECGNEPNLYCYQYPQRRAGQAYYGADTYLRMLKKFHAGIMAGDPTATVIAGANSPRGGNDALSTSPQRFAARLKARGAAKYFDAYSHHPYVTGGARYPQPNKPPYSTKTVVTLYNIKQLLQLFPKRDFYLTEYGYPTAYMRNFGYSVTPVQQASYMRKAYSMATRHRQIKALVWFLVQDTHITFTGMQEQASAGGARKLSWYAFAGGNSITLRAPRRARRGRFFTVSGVLKVREAGYRSGWRLQVQRRPLKGGSWKTVKTVTTNAAGGYSFRFLKQRTTMRYRVIWNGVRESPVRTVRTP